MKIDKRMLKNNKRAFEIVDALVRFGYKTPPASNFQSRLRRNVHGVDRRSTKQDTWNAILIAILTTRQRSGPGSKPANLLESRALSWLRVMNDQATIAREVVGFTYNKDKRKYLMKARIWLDQNWNKVQSWQAKLNDFKPDDIGRYDVELDAARFLAHRESGILGIGEKQSRNFWQFLGYSVWTIPLDSRVRTILEAPPFSMDFGGDSITRKNYLDVERQIIDLCMGVKKNKCYPVLLDSLLFDMEGLMRDLAGFPRLDKNGF